MKDMIVDGEYSASLEDLGFRGMVHGNFTQRGILAGAFPAKPPADWFQNPRLRELTPLTITNDGRVAGHIAAWHQSHIGIAGSVKPPRSRSRYAFFQTGQVETDDGNLVDVGQITLSGGHAPLNASVADAVAHYDNTQSAIMDVSVYEDRHGIAVAGALRPNVSDEQLREIRASAVSGDWRPINGNLELVAVCAVNVPGFPIPRARVASGAPVALVAAGVEPLVAMSMPQPSAPTVDPAAVEKAIRVVNRRVERLERRIAGRALQNRSAFDAAIVAAAGTAATPSVDVEALRARVHAKPVTASATDRAAELRRRVHSS